MKKTETSIFFLLLAAMMGACSLAFSQEIKYYEVQESAAMKVDVPGASVSGYQVKPENLITPQTIDMTGKTTVTQDLLPTAPIVIKKTAGKSYTITVTEKGIIVVPPDPGVKVTIQAESIPIPLGACSVPAGTGRAIGCTKPTVVLRYAIDAKTGAKLILKYSSGVSNGLIQIQSGTLKKSFTVPSTGNFDTYKDWEVDFIPPVGAKDLVFTFVGGAPLGNLNLDSLTY